MLLLQCLVWSQKCVRVLLCMVEKICLQDVQCSIHKFTSLRSFLKCSIYGHDCSSNVQIRNINLSHSYAFRNFQMFPSASTPIHVFLTGIHQFSMYHPEVDFVTIYISYMICPNHWVFILPAFSCIFYSYTNHGAETYM